MRVRGRLAAHALGIRAGRTEGGWRRTCVRLAGRRAQRLQRAGRRVRQWSQGAAARHDLAVQCVRPKPRGVVPIGCERAQLCNQQGRCAGGGGPGEGTDRVEHRAVQHVNAPSDSACATSRRVARVRQSKAVRGASALPFRLGRRVLAGSEGCQQARRSARVLVAIHAPKLSHIDCKAVDLVNARGRTSEDLGPAAREGSRPEVGARRCALEQLMGGMDHEAADELETSPGSVAARASAQATRT